MSDAKSGAAAFDLSRFDVRPRAQEGVELVLFDPRGKLLGLTFRVRGTDSRVYLDKLEEQTKRRRDRIPGQLSDEQRAAERAAEFWELHATLVAGWTPERIQLATGGEPLAWSEANAAKVLEQYPFIFDQVKLFAERRANFLPGLSSS